jgi:hypothetical protein
MLIKNSESAGYINEQKQRDDLICHLKRNLMHPETLAKKMNIFEGGC